MHLHDSEKPKIFPSCQPVTWSYGILLNTLHSYVLTYTNRHVQLLKLVIFFVVHFIKRQFHQTSSVGSFDCDNYVPVHTSAANRTLFHLLMFACSTHNVDFTQHSSVDLPRTWHHPTPIPCKFCHFCMWLSWGAQQEAMVFGIDCSEEGEGSI